MCIRDRYYVSISVTAFEDGKTGPYNSMAWYSISDSPTAAGVTDWRELFSDQFVCDNQAAVCNYVGRDETVPIKPGQYFHVMVGRKFPEFFGWTMFVIDDISIVAADGTLNTTNGCLLYTSDAADERSSVDLGGRRIIKKKKPPTPRYWQQQEKDKHRSEKKQTTSHSIS